MVQAMRKWAGCIADYERFPFAKLNPHAIVQHFYHFKKQQWQYFQFCGINLLTIAK